jgi:flagellar hook assembly protein FlgD
MYNRALSIGELNDYYAAASLVSRRIPRVEKELKLQLGPNPLGATTAIRYVLETSGYVQLRVFDVCGRLLHTLVSRPQSTGTHELVWDGKTAMGTPIPSGMYFLRLEVGNVAESREFVVLR